MTTLWVIPPTSRQSPQIRGWSRRHKGYHRVRAVRLEVEVETQMALKRMHHHHFLSFQSKYCISLALVISLRQDQTPSAKRCRPALAERIPRPKGQSSSNTISININININTTTFISSNGQPRHHPRNSGLAPKPQRKRQARSESIRGARRYEAPSTTSIVKLY